MTITEDLSPERYQVTLKAGDTWTSPLFRFGTAPEEDPLDITWTDLDDATPLAQVRTKEKATGTLLGELDVEFGTGDGFQLGEFRVSLPKSVSDALPQGKTLYADVEFTSGTEPNQTVRTYVVIELVTVGQTTTGED